MNTPPTEWIVENTKNTSLTLKQAGIGLFYAALLFVAWTGLFLPVYNSDIAVPQYVVNLSSFATILFFIMRGLVIPCLLGLGAFATFIGVVAMRTALEPGLKLRADHDKDMNAYSGLVDVVKVGLVRPSFMVRIYNWGMRAIDCGFLVTLVAAGHAIWGVVFLAALLSSWVSIFVVKCNFEEAKKSLTAENLQMLQEFKDKQFKSEGPTIIDLTSRQIEWGDKK